MNPRPPTEPFPSLRRAEHRLRIFRLRTALRLALLPFSLFCLLLTAFAAGFAWLSLHRPEELFWLQLGARVPVLVLLLPLFAFRGWRSARLRPARLAEAWDRANPEAADPFRTVLSLRSHGPETLRALDRLFAPWFPEKGKSPLRAPPGPSRLFSLALPAALLLAALALPFALAFASGDPAGFRARFLTPAAVAARFPRVEIVLRADRTFIVRGDSVRFEATVAVQGSRGETAAGKVLPGERPFEGRPPGISPAREIPLFVHVETQEGERRLPLAAGQRHFVLGPVLAETRVHFSAVRGASNRIAVRLGEAPRPEAVQVVVEAPAYTRLPADTLPPGQLQVTALPGSRIRWTLRMDRPLSRFTWREASPQRPDSSSTLELGGGRDFHHLQTADRDRHLAWTFRGKDGLESREPLRAGIALGKDEPPRLALLAPPGAESALDRNLALALSFTAQDDFGLSALRLQYRILSDGFEVGKGSRNLLGKTAAGPAGLQGFAWNLDSLGLRPEQTVEFHLEAEDGRLPSPNRARTETHRLRLPGFDALLAAGRAEAESAETALRSALGRQRKAEQLLERSLRQRNTERGDLPLKAGNQDLNQVAVENPRHFQRRAEEALKSWRAEAFKNDKALEKPLRDFAERLRRAEAAIPQGDFAALPLAEQREKLQALSAGQEEMQQGLERLGEKMREKAAASPAEAAARRLEDQLAKNRREQGELKEYLEEEARRQKQGEESLRRARAEERKSAEELQDSRERLSRLVERAQREGLASPDLLEKYHRVQELLRRALSDSTLAALEERAKGQKAGAEEVQQELEALLEKRQEVARSLDRALALLEDLQERKRLLEWQRGFAELSRRQKALAGKNEEDREGAGQAAVRREAEALLQDLEKEAPASRPAAALKKTLEEEGRPRALRRDFETLEKNGAAENRSANRKAEREKAALSAAAHLQRMAEASRSASRRQSRASNSLNPAELQRLLQEALDLEQLQLLARRGGEERKGEGWEAEERALYASVAQVAAYLREEAQGLEKKAPLQGEALAEEARLLALASRDASASFSPASAEASLRHNRNFARELLRLLKRKSPGGQGGGEGSAEGEGEGEGEEGAGEDGSSGGKGGKGGPGGASGSDLAQSLEGLSGKQMAINQATYGLLQGLVQGRKPGGRGRGPQGEGAAAGSAGASGGEGGEGGGGDGEEGGEGQEGESGGEGAAKGSGRNPGAAPNAQGDLGEALETLADGAKDGADAQRLRALAEEARSLEEEMRRGLAASPERAEELRRRQDRFRAKLLEASRALEEKGESEERRAESFRGALGPRPQSALPSGSSRLLELLREARRQSRDLPLKEQQRRYLENHFEGIAPP